MWLGMSGVNLTGQACQQAITQHEKQKGSFEQVLLKIPVN